MLEEKDKILLFGYGKYGEKIANRLRQSGFSLYVVDIESKYIKKAKKNGFGNSFVLQDINDDEELLEIIIKEDFKKVFCALDSDEQNIYLTITLKAIFDSFYIVSICESKESERKLKLAGVDKVIDVMEASANKIFHLLEKPAMIEAVESILFVDKEVTFSEIKITNGSFLDKKYIKEIDFKKLYNLILVGIVDKERGERFIFSTKGINHKLDGGDILLLAGFNEDIKRFENDMQKSAIGVVE